VRKVAKVKQTQTVEQEQHSKIIQTRPAIQLSNCKKGGVAKRYSQS
jgi:hypothetical protein